MKQFHNLQAEGTSKDTSLKSNYRAYGSISIIETR